MCVPINQKCVAPQVVIPACVAQHWMSLLQVRHQAAQAFCCICFLGHNTNCRQGMLGIIRHCTSSGVKRYRLAAHFLHHSNYLHEDCHQDMLDVVAGACCMLAELTAAMAQHCAVMIHGCCIVCSLLWLTACCQHVTRSSAALCLCRFYYTPCWPTAIIVLPKQQWLPDMCLL